MSSDRYHKAAKDGLIDVLREATRKEVNSKDVDGMTPVLWAAFEGKLEALRLLVGRGGDPDKSDQFGNTALHLASAKGHMQCVDFLVKFGVNLYSLDIDHHSPQDLAAINNRDTILRYLDAAAANLEATDKKKAKAFKEIAKKHSEKRAREYAKRQQKIEQEIDLDVKTMPHRPSNVLQAFKHRLWSGSQGNLKPTSKEISSQNTTKFSALVGGTISGSRGAVQKKAQALKIKQQIGNSDFKIGEVEASGKRSVRSIQGVRRDSEILYVGTYDGIGDNVGKRGKLTDVFDVESNSYQEDMSDEQEEGKNKFGTLSRSVSQPDFLQNVNDDVAEDVLLQRPSRLFDRPSLGSLAFPRSVSAVLSQLGNDQSSNESSSNSIKTKPKQQRIKPRSQLVISDSESDGSCSETEEQDDGLTPLERFLAAFKLEEHFHIFQKHQVDMDTLMILTESDLKSLGLPLGPFRKLCIAIQERKNALTNPGAIMDSRL